MPFNDKKLFILIILTTFTLSGLTACNYPTIKTDQATATVESQPAVVLPEPEPSATATSVPKTLTVCIGQEPTTLYPYGGTSRSMWSVLDAVYDGPIDVSNYTPQPVILTEMPTLENGGAVWKEVDVKENDQIIDADGNLVTLTAGIKIIPSGCKTGDCAMVWDGKTPVKMDQLQVTFKLKPGIQWSDGQPLTAADSEYSYQVASSKDTPVSKFHIYRTESYQAVDDTSAQWIGKPGYAPASYESLYWIPLPKHSWEQIPAAQLLTSEQSAKKPLGWGPYIIDQWTAGDHIRLVKNPLYFRASEGLPNYDVLVFRFLGEPADNRLDALISGECNIVDHTSMLDSDLEGVLDLQDEGKLKASISQGPEWEFLAFGIKPSSYDDGYQPGSNDRPDFFSDVRTRQAFTYCIDRQAIIDKQLLSQTSIPSGYLAPDHPLYLKDLSPLPYDPEKGKNLLEQVGWKKYDSDPAKPRVAAFVQTVNPGTPFTIDYVTSEAYLRVETAKMIVSNLADCGIQVNVKYLPVTQLFASGANSVLFGRNFDLAQFSWSSGQTPPCQLFESDQIPTAANNWLTMNVTGYSNAEYDSTCQTARYTRTDDQALYEKNFHQAQAYFANELPVIPLYYRVNTAVTRTDFCGYEIDGSARSDMWNIENFAEGSDCQK